MILETSLHMTLVCRLCSRALVLIMGYISIPSVNWGLCICLYVCMI